MKGGRGRGDEKGRVGESLREWDSGDGGRTDMRAYILSVSSEMDNILLKASKKKERERRNSSFLALHLVRCSQICNASYSNYMQSDVGCA